MTRRAGALRDIEEVLKAAGDPTRARILKLLGEGALCVCQVQAVLGMAPSTVSKHLAHLGNAGLVESRRDGKWTEYALADPGRDALAAAVLAILSGPLDADPTIAADRERLREVRSVTREELCATPLRRGAPIRRRPSRPRRRRSAS